MSIRTNFQILLNKIEAEKMAVLNELEFKDKEDFKEYTDGHDIRDTTKVTIDGKEMKAGEVDDKEKTKLTKEDGTPVDLNNQADVKKYAQKHIKETTSKIEKLIESGDIKQAKKVAEKLVKDLNLQQPLYLQEGKENVAKIYVGEKAVKMTGNRTPNVGQKKIVDALEKAGVKIPVKPGGISRTAMSIQQTTSKRSTGKVKTIEDESGKGRLIKELQVGDRKVRFVADPESPNYEVQKLKLQNIQDGDIEFVDIGDTSTKEGRQRALKQTGDDIEKMFDNIGGYIDEKDTHNKEIIKNCKDKLKKLQDPNLSKEEHQQIMLDLLAETKRKGPNGEKSEFVMMTAYLAESVEVMRHLKDGKETLVPSSGNFKTSDVIPLSSSGEPTPTHVTVDGESSSVEYKEIDGTSVKYDGGGASALPAKHENTIYGKNKTEVTINGKKSKDTKEVVGEIINKYDTYFKGDTEMTGSFYKKEEEEMWSAFEGYYPNVDKEKLKKDIDEKIEKAVNAQIKRLDQDLLEKGEGKEKIIQRMKLYHTSQYMAGIISNHPESGIKQQAFANTDFKQKTKKGQVNIELIEADGINTMSWVGFTPDKGYQINEKGEVKPSNTFSSELKHENPSEKMMKKYKKTNK